MRDEFVLLGIILLLLVAEIMLIGKNRKIVAGIATGMFMVHTVIGFFPLPEGVLFGGSYRTTHLLHNMKNIMNVGVVILLLQTWTWAREEWSGRGRMSEFYLLIFSTLLGMYYMVSSGDFLMFFLGLELASLPIGGLAAYDLSKMRSAEAGAKFILMAGLASAISLFGISMIYGITGSLYFSEVAQNFHLSGLGTIGLLFFISGLAFKISLVPFHFWTPDVYEGAPVPVTSYLSVISKAAAIFALAIVLFLIGREFVSIWKPAIYWMAVLTMTVGNLFALRQKNMKRFLAFSSVAQAGFILLGILSFDQMGMAAVVYFAAIYIFSNLATFGVVQVISLKTGKENMDDYNGLYRTNPKLSLVMLLGLFSLAGIPPVAGFFGKFFLFMSAAAHGYYWLVIIAVINVTISLYYYLLVVRAMFLRKSDTPIEPFQAEMPVKIGLALTVVGILTLGLYSPFYDFILNLSTNIRLRLFLENTYLGNSIKPMIISSPL
ncbi:MAG TPA: NADH-quinone oxidoreductase subunit N [Saprospiraceae bacterium]|nr:NADH-quinone oxidoreductase subunit N [Saprospiraceae bacterium]